MVLSNLSINILDIFSEFFVGEEKAVPASSISRAWGFGTLGI